MISRVRSRFSNGGAQASTNFLFLFRINLVLYLARVGYTCEDCRRSEGSEWWDEKWIRNGWQMATVAVKFSLGVVRNGGGWGPSTVYESRGTTMQSNHFISDWLTVSTVFCGKVLVARVCFKTVTKLYNRYYMWMRLKLIIYYFHIK